MRISFWGSSDFSLEILKELYKKSTEGRIELVYVVSQPAKPFGRKKELKNNLVVQYCINNGINLLLPEKLDKAFRDELPRVDISFVAAYGHIISEKILNTTRYGFINFHGSILPKYRGAIPVQLTIMNQDIDGGITIIKMDKGMDTGKIISAYKVDVERNITSGELMNTLAKLSAKKINEDFDLIFNPNLWQLQPQDESIATYSYEKDFTKEKFGINYEDGVKLAHGKIMAANPEPKAWIKINGSKNYNLIRSAIGPEIPADISELEKKGELGIRTNIAKRNIYLELNDGFLEIVQIQPEGKNVMDAKSFINGYLIH